MGHGLPDLARALGMASSRPLYKIRSGEQKNINTSTGRKIHTLYEQRCMVKLEGRYPDEISKDAYSRGWKPPLWWDDIDRDNDPDI